MVEFSGELSDLMSHFFRAFLHFLFHLGYFGPLVMGVLDSSFLVLPFGNDLLVVGLVAHHHDGLPFYVVSAAIGSTIGVLLLAVVARRFGEKGIAKLAGQKQFDMLKRHMDKRAGFLIALACVAPPPFPFTMVIAASGALGYSFVRLAIIDFFARSVRFIVLGLLAIKFGRQFLRIGQSEPFLWSMSVFIIVCFVASGISIWHWTRTARAGKQA
ncbi:MAG TPA: VTT domain-containing protein [Acidobacteriaceae bacterium]|nr:VTT domain-containing protein [Acidobacteriaceae bacterium]